MIAISSKLAFKIYRVNEIEVFMGKLKKALDKGKIERASIEPKNNLVRKRNLHNWSRERQQL